jgi:hypothetical protein
VRGHEQSDRHRSLTSLRPAGRLHERPSRRDRPGVPVRRGRPPNSPPPCQVAV